MTRLIGIDVSEHQGIIDWEKVKKDGIKFAMIRVGVGSDIKEQDDKMFERNVKECERVGIKWGAYLYSYALTIQDAKSEAKHMLRLLEGKKPSFPIAFDMEDADGYKKRKGIPSNKVLVDICDTFLNEVESHGYYVSLYASKSWFTNQLNSSKLDRYDKWLAQWSSIPTFNKPYHMWQYQSKGVVSGIRGYVDMNIAYSDFSFIKISEPTKNYIVKNGDTLNSIAKVHKISLEKLLEMNQDLIKEKQVLKVPNK